MHLDSFVGEFNKATKRKREKSVSLSTSSINSKDVADRLAPVSPLSSSATNNSTQISANCLSKDTLAHHGVGDSCSAATLFGGCNEASNGSSSVMSAPSTDNNTAVIDATTGSNTTNGSNSDKNKKKKARTTFTGRQIFELEKQFEIKKYLSSSERSDMAKLLTVTETQVNMQYVNLYEQPNCFLNVML